MSNPQNNEENVQRARIVNGTNSYGINEAMTIRNALGLRRCSFGIEHGASGSNGSDQHNGNGPTTDNIMPNGSDDVNSQTVR
jgi:hypothetical protein